MSDRMLDFLAEAPAIGEPPELDPELDFPAPWFGGKRRAAKLVWEHIGDVPNWLEFCGGSGAVTLHRPRSHRPRIETINDLDGLLMNFWRALRADPDGLATLVDQPVAEVDLHARHRWLRARRATLSAELEADPHYYDLQAAAWWVWGASCWIGTGWCAEGAPSRQLPDLGGSTARGEYFPNAGKGVNGFGMRESSKMPRLGAWAEGVPHVGIGVHALGMRQLPDLGGSGLCYGAGVHGLSVRTALYDVFSALARRLRYVRFPCGDWKRIASPAVTWRHGTTGILIDPPYPSGAIDYAVGGRVVAQELFAWAVEHGVDERLRIAFCGYEGDFVFPSGWACVRWKGSRGYSNQRRKGENDNAELERIWFSPHCAKAAAGQASFRF